MHQHNWTYEDDVVAYYLYRKGLDSLLHDLNSISKKLGMKPGSMKMGYKILRLLNLMKKVATKDLKIGLNFRKRFMNTIKTYQNLNI
jgi:hypothetical protein